MSTDSNYRSPLTYVWPSLWARIVNAAWFVVGLASIAGAVVWASLQG
jgi:hypothetical protein